MKMADQQPTQSNEVKNETAVNETNAEPKSITNIYYDCLERIFDFLDLESLLNVAGTCKRLQIAAAAKFGDDHGQKYVCVNINNPIRSDLVQKEGIQSKFSRIDVSGSELCLRFLRCFGSKVLSLNVQYVKNQCALFGDLLNDRVDHYINEYCANTLTRIELKNRMPFKNVVAETTNLKSQLLSNTTSGTSQNRRPPKCFSTVKICLANLSNRLPNLAIVFPNMRFLHLGFVSIAESTVAVHFPHLSELSIRYLNSRQNGITTQFVESFLRANPQLQKLSIQLAEKLTLNEILDLINGNPSLSKLSKSEAYGKEIGVDAAEVNRLVNERTLMEELILWNHRFTVDDAIMLISQLNSLKRFEFLVKDQFECDRFINQLDNDWKFKHHIRFDGILIKLNR